MSLAGSSRSNTAMLVLRGTLTEAGSSARLQHGCRLRSAARSFVHPSSHAYSTCFPAWSLATGRSQAHPSPSRISSGSLAKHFSSTGLTHQEATPSTAATSESKEAVGESAAEQSDPRILVRYAGPLSKTFRRLKIFSLSSLGLSTALAPAILLAPAEVGLQGRLVLCAAALSTSGTSTALIAWIAGAYTTSMRLVRPSKEEQDALTTSSHTDQPWMEIENTSWRLQKLETTIYDLSFIRPTQRPFATWELTLTPEPVALADLPDKGAEQDTHEVVISETRFAQSGKLRGRLLVRYSKDALTRGEDGSWKAEGRILKQGKPCRHFQVHEAMLGEEWQVLD